MAWDDELFARIGEDYDGIFAQEVEQTEAQADFALRVLGLRPGQRVLDVCCGPGRHALALARRGMDVTALDRDGVLLAMGRRRAAAAGLTVRWVEADARRPPRLGVFAGAMCLFASWGYAGDPAEDGLVLAGVARGLAPGARFLLDVPNLTWLAAHPTGRSLSLARGTAVREERRFHPDSRTLDVSWDVRRRGRPRWTTDIRYRVYALEEMEWHLAAAGLVLDAAYGGFDGSSLTAQSPRCVVLSRRPILPGGARPRTAAGGRGPATATR